VNHLTDEELIARRLRGDTRAMDELVSRYHGKLLEFALRQLGDRDAAADVAQAALVRAFESAASFRGEATFKTWLYAIALNLIREDARKRRRRGETLLSDLDTELLTETVGDSSPEDTALENIASAAIWESVAGLPESQKTVVILRFRMGLNYEEISEVMGAPVGTARSWAHHAMKALRRALEPTNCEG